MSRFAQILSGALLLASAVAPSLAAQQASADPFVWLEDIDAKRSMDWVNAHNAATVAELSSLPVYQQLYPRIKSALESRDKIAYPEIVGDRIYNFWKDAQHERGIWRRTTWDSYVSGSPQWETVLDIDSLAKAENVPWAWGGANCLDPDNRRCLVSLSRGGSDASEMREMDVVDRKFVADGFKLPEAKSGVEWVDSNSVLVGTDFGQGSMTASGYARILKLWKRGTPLSAASTVYEVPADHVGAGAFAVNTAGRRYIRIDDNITFYTTTHNLYQNGQIVKLDVPADADVYHVGDQMIVFVRDPWTVGGTTWPTGSLVAISIDDFLGGKRDLKLVMQPTSREAIQGISATKDYLLIEVLNNVRAELRRYHYANGAWSFVKVPAPDLGSVSVAGSTPRSDRFFFTYQTFIQPTTLYMSDDAGRVSEVKRLPAMFDAKGLVVEQMETTSADGTRIPYFLVHREGVKRTGDNPTLLTAYGGFEVPSTPYYSAVGGLAWLERGGVYVLANIRGGGEFGPQWHRAGLKENRQRIYDDFTAVAKALVTERITSSRHLGIIGGSNGGLLMGVAMTEHPELYNAIVIASPLLDMQRYNHLLAGASWVAEYGDPDKPGEWAYISKYSPYQNLRANTKYPRVMFTTTTRDDRVHPGHARKMAAKMESMGYPFYYFENTEGGHGSGVTIDQQAKDWTLIYTYLWHQLQ